MSKKRSILLEEIHQANSTTGAVLVLAGKRKNQYRRTSDWCKVAPRAGGYKPGKCFWGRGS